MNRQANNAFIKTLREAVSEAHSRGNISGKVAKVYEGVLKTPATASIDEYGELIQVHTIWRLHITRMYLRNQAFRGEVIKLPLTSINWEQIKDWVLDNIVPIMKVLMMVVPFILI